MTWQHEQVLECEALIDALAEWREVLEAKHNLSAEGLFLLSLEHEVTTDAFVIRSLAT